MLKALFDGVMDRRSARLIDHVAAWLPAEGPVLDVGSGTGHLSSRLERELGLEVVPADVTDMHVCGRPPVMIVDGTLPFEQRAFSAALLFFMLHYPREPVALLAEAARVTRGPVIVVQSLYANRIGYTWLRIREFLWTTVAFHVSRAIGYVSPRAEFTMNARRFYTADRLRQDAAAAGLRIGSRRDRRVLPGGALVIAGFRLERDD